MGKITFPEGNAPASRKSLTLNDKVGMSLDALCKVENPQKMKATPQGGKGQQRACQQRPHNTYRQQQQQQQQQQQKGKAVGHPAWKKFSKDHQGATQPKLQAPAPAPAPMIFTNGAKPSGPVVYKPVPVTSRPQRGQEGPGRGVAGRGAGGRGAPPHIAQQHHQHFSSDGFKPQPNARQRPLKPNKAYTNQQQRQQQGNRGRRRLLPEGELGNVEDPSHPYHHVFLKKVEDEVAARQRIRMNGAKGEGDRGGAQGSEDDGMSGGGLYGAWAEEEEEEEEVEAEAEEAEDVSVEAQRLLNRAAAASEQRLIAPTPLPATQGKFRAPMFHPHSQHGLISRLKQRSDTAAAPPERYGDACAVDAVPAGADALPWQPHGSLRGYAADGMEYDFYGRQLANPHEGRRYHSPSRSPPPRVAYLARPPNSRAYPLGDRDRDFIEEEYHHRLRSRSRSRERSSSRERRRGSWDGDEGWRGYGRRQGWQQGKRELPRARGRRAAQDNEQRRQGGGERDRDGLGGRGGRGGAGDASRNPRTMRLRAKEVSHRFMEERRRQREEGGHSGHGGWSSGRQPHEPLPFGVPSGRPSAAITHASPAHMPAPTSGTVYAQPSEFALPAGGGGSGQLVEVDNMRVTYVVVAIEDVLKQQAGHRVVLPLEQLQRLKACMAEGKMPVLVDLMAGAGKHVTLQPEQVVRAMCQANPSLDLEKRGENLVCTSDTHMRSCTWILYQLESGEDLGPFFLSCPPEFYDMDGEQQSKCVFEWFKHIQGGNRHAEGMQDGEEAEEEKEMEEEEVDTGSEHEGLKAEEYSS